VKKTDPKLKSAMWSLIKEEIKKILSENLQDLKDTPLNQLEPGNYYIAYTTENRSGAGDTTYTLTLEDIASGENPYWFWKAIAGEDYLFEKGDSIQYVKKV